MIVRCVATKQNPTAERNIVCERCLSDDCMISCVVDRKQQSKAPPLKGTLDMNDVILRFSRPLEKTKLMQKMKGMFDWSLYFYLSCVPVCLPVCGYGFECLSLCLCLCICLPVALSVCLSVPLWLFLWVHNYVLAELVNMFVCLCVSVYLSATVSFCLSVCLSLGVSLWLFLGA